MILGKRDKQRVAELEAQNRQVQKLDAKLMDAYQTIKAHQLWADANLDRATRAEAQVHKLRAELADRTDVRRDALTLAVLADPRLQNKNMSVFEIRNYVTVLLDLPSPDEETK